MYDGNTGGRPSVQRHSLPLRTRAAKFLAALLFLSALAPASSSTGEGPPNVVLISIDTLRADHLSIYGYHRATTPFLSSMAKQGVVFENTWVTMPVTTPNHGSMLTGVYPSRHGSLALSVPLDRRVETIAAALKKKGYHTIGTVAVSHIGRAGNFDQGFDDFSGTPDGTAKRAGNAVNADVFRFVSAYAGSRSRKPLFLFVHYFDCHAPYGWWCGTDVDVAKLPTADRNERYDESIRHVDRLLGDLYRFLRQKRLTDNTIFIVTSDHGEQIGERGLAAGHADIYSETSRVPLIAFGGGLPAGRVRERVSTLDVSPSIAAAARVQLAHVTDGRNILPGRADGLEKLLFRIRGLPDSTSREVLIVGNPWYTRSIELLSGPYVFIKNLDHVYRSYRQIAVKALTKTDAARMKELNPLIEIASERRYVIPVTSYSTFTVTVDVVADSGGCSGSMNVALAPGFVYFSAPLQAVARNRVQFSAARLDTMWIGLNSSSCKGRVFYRIDRPADAPKISGPPVQTSLFAFLYAERKNSSKDEIYDIETDSSMKRNLIDDPRLASVRAQLEKSIERKYREIYGAALGSSRSVPLLPPEEIQKLKSLGYIF